MTSRPHPIVPPLATLSTRKVNIFFTKIEFLGGSQLESWRDALSKHTSWSALGLTRGPFLFPYFFSKALAAVSNQNSVEPAPSTLDAG